MFLPLPSLPQPRNNHPFTSLLGPVIFPSKMPHFLKTPTSFIVGFHRASRHVSTTSNHCRKLSTTPIQQRNGVRFPRADYCFSLSELNQKWTERLQKHDVVWSKRLQEADSLRLKSTVELEAMRFERSQKQWEENEHLSLEIHNLHVRLPYSPSPVICVLTFYQEQITTEEESMEQLKQILNIRGALRM